MGDTRFRLRVSFLGALLRAFGITFVVWIILLPASLILTVAQVHYSFNGWLLLLFFIILGYYLAFRWYLPSFPLQVSSEYLATPKRVRLIQQRGEPREEREFKLERLRPSKIDLKDYIHTKSNRNVLITGSSGQGKSKLTRHLLNEMSYQKVIFSFKAGEEYLKMGYNIRDISKTLPDPFANSEAFINAFVVAFPLGSIGIQASLVPTTLEKLVKKSRSWPEFNKVLEKEMKATRETNTKSALSFIKAHSARLAYDTGGFSIGSETLVLDFSSLNEDAKSFYAELVLRQLYADLEHRKRKDMLICVDEAHRLTTGDFGRYHTIIVEMSREIRDKGMLWITTQNYTDIPDSIRNQFASQFIFKTTGHNDMTALKAIEPLLAWTISSLPKHYFVDAQFQDIHTHIPAFYYNPQGEADLKPAVDETTAVSTAGEPKTPEDRPTATIHAGLLAIYYNPKVELAGLAKWVSTKKFVNSPSSIYGNKGRKGIFETAVSLGYAREVGKHYELTSPGRKWIEPKEIIKDAPNLGSDLHQQLLIKTIEKLHEENMLVIAPKENNAFDLIAYSPDKKKKYLWDDKKARGYEIQTTARKDSIVANGVKKEKYGIPMTWVTYTNELLEEIKKLADNKDEYLLIKLS
ncbi:MAG TPA: ATP-binding protein [Candidatus Acidoferrum sp.]|nr:ATP-binding protein [Candidatus Acidoferrum sp.]